VSGQIHAPAALPLGKAPPVPIEQEAGWADAVELKKIPSFFSETPYYFYRRDVDLKLGFKFPRVFGKVQSSCTAAFINVNTALVELVP
jgi:hypothetical protein